MTTPTYITWRERDVLNMICEGLTAKEIAGKLYISKHTVDTHRKHLIEKAGAKNTVEMVVKLLQERSSIADNNSSILHTSDQL